jgi:xanthine dehydrogenase accessory factor|tara:strand:- start:442 stop:1419 length:978 start_codon:yes stop_codon:yes gene_type:complete
MYNDLIDQISKYMGQGEEFAVAHVIWREAPSSGKPGDKAIILKDGTIIGWIGGGCVKGIAVKEAREAIRENRSRLVRIDPDEVNSEDSSHKTYRMTCHSGGTMELFIEPITPNPQLIIVGKSNIARALSKLAIATNLRVHVLSNDVHKGMFPGVNNIHDRVDFSKINIDKNTFIVVSTQGEDDEESIRKALETNCNYVGFISSLRKSVKIKEYLEQTELSTNRINELKIPVGMDINAKLPEEIAISILAEIVQLFRDPNRKEDQESDTAINDDTYINPVCRVAVSKKDAKHVLEYGAHTVYFCCDGCKVSFDTEPEKYIEILESR